MNAKPQSVTICCLLIASFLISACGLGESFVSTSTPTLTSTMTPTLSPTPTSTPTFTKTPTPTPDLRIINPENSHLYLYVGMEKTWHGASTYCQSRSGHLVTTESASENDFVYNLSEGNTWLGASDEIQEGTWVWVTGEQLTYTNWAQGEPNNCTDCTGIHFEEGEDLAHFKDVPPDKWNDWPNLRSTFVCEWDTSE